MTDKGGKMQTGEGGYWIKFESEDEEKEFHVACHKKAMELAGIIGGIMSIMSKSQQPEIKTESLTSKRGGDSWISVKDRLPEKEGAVIIYAESADPNSPLIVSCWYTPNEGFGLVEVWAKAVSHWMPMPDPPKEA